MANESNDLTAREMFDILLAGKKVGVIAQCEQDPNLIRLLNHLNVIKCRSRKVYEELGLEWENSIIQISPSLPKLIAGSIATISLITPTPSRKYGAFIIIDKDDANNGSNTENKESQA